MRWAVTMRLARLWKERLRPPQLSGYGFYLVVGDTARIERLLAKYGAPGNVELRHASEVIEPDDEASEGGEAQEGRLDGRRRSLGEGLGRPMDFLSAGNTGALMAVGLLVIGRIKGIHRPALAPLIPTLSDTGVLALDLGANMDAAPEHLVQYALMGHIYRTAVHGMDQSAHWPASTSALRGR